MASSSTLRRKLTLLIASPSTTSYTDCSWGSVNGSAHRCTGSDEYWLLLRTRAAAASTIWRWSNGRGGSASTGASSMRPWAGASTSWGTSAQYTTATDQPRGSLTAP